MKLWLRIKFWWYKYIRRLDIVGFYRGVPVIRTKYLGKYRKGGVKMEYTKGEWAIDCENQGNGGFAEWYTVDTRTRHIACIANGARLDDEDKANAQLIASAPDLYEALKAIDGYLSASFPANLTRKKSAVELLDKALAKAEGVNK